MTTVQPEGESIRKAINWISEEAKQDPSKSKAKLIEEACIRFNLTPIDAEFLMRKLKGN